MLDTISNLQDLKNRLKATWVAGDFGKIAVPLEPAAAEFIARREIKPGIRVLDVACGTGNLAFPAARSGADVTGIDIAPNLIEQARTRAGQEGLKIAFDEGDAEALPYPDASFDLVVTMFGAMFAPRPDRTTAELLRVCRPGGEIAMANWTPRGFIGQMFKITAKHLPPPPGMAPPVLWGEEKTVRERLREGVADLRMAPVIAQIAYPFSPARTVEYFREYFGPIRNAFAALPQDKQAALRSDLEAHWSTYNKADDGSTCVEAEYLEVVAKRA